MPLVTTREMLLAAQRAGYAVGAFNIENMEMAQAIVSAAEKAKSPVILQTTPSTLKYAPSAVFAGIVKALAEKSPVPIALHLDHGDSLSLCKTCLETGFTSVMIDGSALDFEANMSLSAEAAKLAGAIPVEAELGKVGGKEDDAVAADPGYTDPDEAAILAGQSGISSLAVAIGTVHGFYKGVPRLDIELLKKIRGKVSLPLVLHGASGLSDDVVMECIKNGVCKVNFATELRAAFTNASRETLKNATLFDPKDFGEPARAAVEALVIQKMAVCGCSGRGQ